MFEQKQLPDYLAVDLDIVSIGINPSVHSASSGYPFSSPRNRFWPALNQSKLVSRAIEPSPKVLCELLVSEGLGFTDIVKRPTKGISELRAADYRQGAKQLQKKLIELRPRIAWFQGMTAARYFYKYVGGLSSDKVVWGTQNESHFPFLVFVSPNPSPANAAYSFEDLIRYFNQLAKLKARIAANNNFAD